MKESFKQYLIDHSQKGVWTGGVENGVPVITYMGETKPAEPFLAQLGIKLAKTTKYTESKENAGMGEPHTGGDTPDAGDGVSEIQE